MITRTDIDIDFADRDKALEGLSFVSASMVRENGELSRHTSGVYFQDIPVNPLTGLAAFTYEDAEDKGYFKIDFLNQSVYSDISNEAHLDRLINTEPMWELLLERGLVEQLTQIKHHYETIRVIKPKSIEDLAVVLALIRPGKRHLLYQNRAIIDKEIWKPESNGYQFKRSHAISYAVLILVQMNLILEKMSTELNSEPIISF